MSEQSHAVDVLYDLAVIDGLLMCLAARGATQSSAEVVVVMPGVYERARVEQALKQAVRLGAKRFICTGTNPEERSKGEAYDEALIRGIFQGLFPDREPPFRIETDVVGDNSRMQAQNAARRLVAEPPTGIVMQTGGSWHTPRSFLAFLMACDESFREAGLPIPDMYPMFVDTGLGAQIQAASDAHIASGYGAGAEGLSRSARAEVERRLLYTPKGHLAALSQVRQYVETLLARNS